MFGRKSYHGEQSSGKINGGEKVKRLRSWMGIALAVVVTISVLMALTAPTTAIHDTPGSQSGEAQFAYAKHLELQTRPVEYPQSFEDMKKLMGERLQLLSERLEDIGGSSASNTVPIEESKRMFVYPNLSENFLRLWDTTAIPDLSESQSRGEHRASTKKHELESRPSFEDLMGVDDMEKQIEYRKVLQSERMEMRDKSEDPQPIVTFVHSSTGNEVTKFSSSFDISPIEEPRMMQGSGYLNLSGNYSTLWHQSLEANDTSAEIIPDIDGDNNPDVLVGAIKYNPVTDVETVTVIAKKGTNGTHLWEQSVSASGRENCGIAVYPLDDLDGDGLDDFLAFEWTYNESTAIATITVIAKKGTNGTHLWEESVSSGTEFYIAVYWGDDLDGDGLGDFIFLEGIYDSVTYTGTEEIIAKRGYDGTLLWKQTVSGEACEMKVDRIVDLDGDGLDDVIVNVWKYDYWAGAEAAKVTAKRGYDGILLWEQTTSGWACDMYVDWVAELDGDGLDDVIVNAWRYDIWTSTEAAKVTAKRGYDGTHLWEQSISAIGYENCDKWVEGLADLDGDGLDDVIVYEWLYDESTGTDTVKLIAKKGTNGTHLWEQSVNASGYENCEMWLDWFVDLDGDGRDDVVVYEWVYNETADTATGILIAKNGNNGTHLWEQSVSASGEWNCDKWVEELVDLDGDKLYDVIVKEWIYNDSTGTNTTNLIAKKGTNGTHLWEQSVNASGYWNCDIRVDELIDLDGDSLDDVIVYEWVYNESTGTNTTKIIAKKGTNGTHLWEQSVSGTECFIWAWPLLDLDEDGKFDVLVHEWTYNESNDTMMMEVIAKRGYDGTHLWNQSLSDTECFIFAEPLFLDLDGDGGYDFIVYEYVYNASADTEEMSVIAKRGYNGTHLWEQSVNASGYENCDIEIGGIVDLDGDGRFEVIVCEGEYNESANLTTVKVIAKEGNNGTHLWEESVTASGYRTCNILAGGVVDLDGDGLGDVIGIVDVYNESTDTWTETVIAKRGYDGTHLFEAQAEGPIRIATWRDGYDLDGDGQNDLLLWIPTEVYAVTHSGIYPNLFDTGEPTIPYPSIMGTFNGRLTLSHDLVVHRLYTYPCSGTGGHSESVRIWGDGIDTNATWDGYKGDWHNITFDEPFVTLEAGKMYNITIELGSYPQIHHAYALLTVNGWINCKKFEDVNGNVHYNWIPAIRIE